MDADDAGEAAQTASASAELGQEAAAAGARISTATAPDDSATQVDPQLADPSLDHSAAGLHQQDPACKSPARCDAPASPAERQQQEAATATASSSPSDPGMGQGAALQLQEGLDLSISDVDMAPGQVCLACHTFVCCSPSGNMQKTMLV